MSASTSNSPLLSATLVHNNVNCFCPIHNKSTVSFVANSNPSSDNNVIMWRTNCAKKGLSKSPRFIRATSEVGLCKNVFFSDVGICRKAGGGSEIRERMVSRCVSTSTSTPQASFLGLCPKGYTGVVEAEVAANPFIEREVSIVDELQVLLDGWSKEEEVKERLSQQVVKEVETVPRLGEYDYLNLWDRQIKIETEAWKMAVDEYRELLTDMCKHKLIPNLPYMKSLFLGWFEPFRDLIVEDQEKVRLGGCRATYAPFIDLLPADMMAVITMHKLVGMLMSGEVIGRARVVDAACAIGEALEQELMIHKFLTKTKKRRGKKDKIPEEGCSEDVILEQQKLRKQVDDMLKKQRRKLALSIVSSRDDSKPWGMNNKARIGSRLIELLVKTANVQVPNKVLMTDGSPEVRPAFTHKVVTSGAPSGRAGRKCGIIECDPLVIDGLEKTPKHMMIPYMPMLVPPQKWTGYGKGAYLVLQSYIMRTHGSKRQRHAFKRAPRRQLETVFEALDTLGNTKWRVNNEVFNVVKHIWANGGGLADLVDRYDVPLPEKPDSDDEKVLLKWRWNVRLVQKENKERHALRCETELKLAVAQRMKHEEGFYYPHNIDFRGRAYPMHPHLNHLGSDMCRGVLEFAEGRPLGKSGLNWLKVHLANLYASGIDKLSHDGRIAFVDNHLDDIFDSADKPLEGRRWWLNAEDPFQCLAVCFDIAACLRSPFPEAYISHLPVHQDGSCNGLQHYAALGRDKLGAAAVNLVPGDKPADVYSSIAARVQNIMKRDAQRNPAIFPSAIHARKLVDQVDRKLVKQTVMTSVYGVTYIGARDQIRRRLKEREIFNDDDELFGASCYTAKITLAALGEMFQGARRIMEWLGDCAKIIASENQPVEWTTPVGLPVLQPYCVKKSQAVRTSLQVLSLEKETEKIIVRRQKTAFPPNFVHSLDGSHMMMTALGCKKAGLIFAGVHDSYWTHARDVDQMNKILREKFVELYDQPILEDLLEGFRKSFPTLLFPPLPERGNFNLKQVLDSPYFFN